MNKKLLGLFVILFMLISVAAPAHAAGLTSVQINAIIGLLQSFGTDQSTINNVKVALGVTSTDGGTQLPGPIGDSPGCIYLTQSLIVGSTDATTNGEVSKLQQFLVVAGVYPEARITGYYGILTAQAVVRWQKAHGMDFVTTASGVGPMTRAKLREQCGKSISLPATCTDQQGTVPVITSISPLSGPIGTSVLIDGCNLAGFEGDLDAVFVRSDGAKIPLYGGTGTGAEQGKHMTVTVQSYCASGSETGRYSGIVSPCTTVQATPGVYKVYVTAWGKNSNEATFTIK